LIEDLAALEPAVHVHPQGLERIQIETAQAVAQGVVPESALGTDPVREIGVAQLAVQLLEAGQAKDKGVEQSQEDTGWGDLRDQARVRHLGSVFAQFEACVQPG
jgi:hypothetical protein